MEHYLNCKKVDTAINRARNILIGRANKHGVYENFGQEEVSNIYDKFIDLSDYSKEMNLVRDKINAFDNWCSSYTIKNKYK